jgi:hypothetical protein
MTLLTLPPRAGVTGLCCHKKSGKQNKSTFHLSRQAGREAKASEFPETAEIPGCRDLTTGSSAIRGFGRQCQSSLQGAQLSSQMTQAGHHAAMETPHSAPASCFSGKLSFPYGVCKRATASCAFVLFPEDCRSIFLLFKAPDAFFIPAGKDLLC